MKAKAQVPLFYWAWGSCELAVLIPKQNGKGWLKVPAGHHAEKRIWDIQNVARCDVSGLDGTLEFDCGWDYPHDPDKRREFEERVFPAIERLYKCRRGRDVGYDALFDMMDGVRTPEQCP